MNRKACATSLAAPRLGTVAGRLSLHSREQKVGVRSLAWAPVLRSPLNTNFHRFLYV